MSSPPLPCPALLSHSLSKSVQSLAQLLPCYRLLGAYQTQSTCQGSHSSRVRAPQPKAPCLELPWLSRYCLAPQGLDGLSDRSSLTWESRVKKHSSHPEPKYLAHAACQYPPSSTGPLVLASPAQPSSGQLPHANWPLLARTAREHQCCLRASGWTFCLFQR